MKYFLLTLVELPLIALALISNNQPTKAFVADNVTTATSYTSDISPAGARYAIRVNSPARETQRLHAFTCTKFLEPGKYNNKLRLHL